MRKPPNRPELPPRQSNNDKRRLRPSPEASASRLLSLKPTYHGISKHKTHPVMFGLPEYTGRRGDETHCDGHAQFGPEQMSDIPGMVTRGIRAGLMGEVDRQGLPTMLWAIADTGWIFEARLTNSSVADYHGYPVRPTEAIAEPVFRRFAAWARTSGDDHDKKAADACRDLYGFKP